MEEGADRAYPTVVLVWAGRVYRAEVLVEREAIAFRPWVLSPKNRFLRGDGGWEQETATVATQGRSIVNRPLNNEWLGAPRPAS